MNAYETARQQKIAQNDALARDLGIRLSSGASARSTKPPLLKKRKPEANLKPTRTSARIATAPIRLSYDEEDGIESAAAPFKKATKNRRRPRPQVKQDEALLSNMKNAQGPAADIDSIRAGWTDWKPVAPLPSRDELNGMFYFESHPAFTPNKSPAEMLREGAFGGSYFRPLYSSKLRVTVEDDWRELPEDWLAGLNIETFLTKPIYDPEVNKYKVSCGQSIEQWEQNGWIDHQHDVRGWFQWYCRFFIGRRCDDDDRQVSRWARCAGSKGRWRRALLKKYKQLGIHSVMDDGEDDEDAPDVSPVVHQTCHHWAFEVRQNILEEFLKTEGG